MFYVYQKKEFGLMEYQCCSNSIVTPIFMIAMIWTICEKDEDGHYVMEYSKVPCCHRKGHP